MTLDLYAVRIGLRLDFAADGCWLWQGRRTRFGYGVIDMEGKGRFVHRVVLERIYGTPIPEGMEVDHLCRQTPCCNPEHLEVVTHTENLRRGVQATATHCVRGHLRTEDNLYHPPKGGRGCRTCRRDDAALRYAAAVRNGKVRLPADPEATCKRGHQLTEDNLVKSAPFARVCLECRRWRNREWMRRQRTETAGCHERALERETDFYEAEAAARGSL